VEGSGGKANRDYDADGGNCLGVTGEAWSVVRFGRGGRNGAKAATASRETSRLLGSVSGEQKRKEKVQKRVILG